MTIPPLMKTIKRLTKDIWNIEKQGVKNVMTEENTDQLKNINLKI